MTMTPSQTENPTFLRASKNDLLPSFPVASAFSSFGKGAFGRLEVGAQIPFQVNENIDAFDVELHPDPEPTPYAAYEITKAIQHGRQLGLTFYYDAYRFDPSPSKRVRGIPNPIHQPKSDMDVIGLRVGLFW